MGVAAGELAAGGVAGKLRQAFGKAPASGASALLSGRNAKRLAEHLSHLRGAAMKLGQLVSMDTEHVLPPEFSEALAVLRASADAMPVAQVRRLLGREYGKGWESRFASFDFEPVASASIGQVHRARTPDGRDLALKIQYPGVAKSIDSDVDNLAMFLNMARILPRELDVEDIITEAKRQLRREADYLAEADSLDRFWGLLESDPRFVVPRVHRDLTTRRILAMDWMSGEPLEDAGQVLGQEDRDAVGRAIQELTFRELFEFRFMQTDPNFANYVYRPGDGRIGLLDFGATVEFPPDFSDRYRRITRAILARDRVAIAEVASEIGYLRATDSARHREMVVDLILMVCEPIWHEGPYDFGASNLPARATAAGLDLVFGSREFRNPPAATAFLHRKLGGAFLLCQRLKARVDIGRIASAGTA
jgi:predicted unusual protein kinase regulating ubiquinone biosynthesis (AarF/ABC1/UbiB family)